MKKQLKRILIAFLDVFAELVKLALKIAVLVILSPVILFQSAVYAIKQRDFLSGVQMAKWVIKDVWNY